LTYTLTITAARFAFPYEPWQLAMIGGVIAVAWERLGGASPKFQVESSQLQPGLVPSPGAPGDG
jgi:hypothetical protein